MKIQIITFLLAASIGCGTSGNETEPTANNTVDNKEFASSPTTPKADDKKTKDESAKEGHEHSAPHDGILIEIGDEFAHIELVHDQEKGAITAYILDGEAENAARIEQGTITILWEKGEITLDAVENALTGEKRGDTSQFAIKDESLKTLSDVEARIKEITVRGKQFKDISFKLSKENDHGHGH